MRRSYYVLCALFVFFVVFLTAGKVSSATLSANLAWCTANSGAINVSYGECRSLAFLYNETSGDNWNATGNRFSNTDLRTWKGGDGTNAVAAMSITGGHVITLSLDNNNLVNSVNSGFVGLPFLSGLSINSDHLVSMNTSGMTSLRSVDITFNVGLAADFSHTTGLISLNTYICFYNSAQMNALIAPLHNLEILNVRNNYLDSGIDLSGMPYLKSFSGNESNLPSLDVSHNTGLTFLNVNYNAITYLDLSQNTLLTIIDAHENSLTGVNLNNPLATQVSFNTNNLTSIDTSRLTGAEFLDLSDNNLTSIDITRNSLVYGLYLGNNNISYISLSGQSTLAILELQHNTLTGINLLGAPSLGALSIQDQQGGGITSLDISHNLILSSIVATGNNIQTLVTAAPGLYPVVTSFNFAGNPLSNVTNPNALSFLSSHQQYTTVRDFTGTAGDTFFYLYWGRPTDFGHSGDLYKYRLSLGGNASGSFDITNLAATGYLATGLLNDIDYGVNICAVYHTSGADESSCDGITLTPRLSVCVPGTTLTTGGGLPTCVPCEIGTFNNTTGGACQAAPMGSFVGVAGAASAIRCEPGHYSNTTGAYACEEAELGTYIADFGATGSMQCPLNTYANFRGASSCTPCPDNYTSNTGSMACTQISVPSGGGGGGGIRTVSIYNTPIIPVIKPILIPTTQTSTVTRGDIYNRAFSHNITTLPLPKARLDDQIQRYEAAKMIVNYAKNVEHKVIQHNPLCDISLYSDYNTFDTEMKGYITTICDLGLMGWKSPKSLGLISIFRPFDYLGVNEFNIVIERYLESSTPADAQSNKRIDIMKFLMEQSQD